MSIKIFRRALALLPCIFTLLVLSDAFPCHYLAFDGTENGILQLPLQFQESPASITISLWTLFSGSQANNTSLLFFVGPAVAAGTQPGWGILRTALSGRDGALSLFQMNSQGMVSTFRLPTNLPLNDWSYLSFVISRIEAATNRTSISIYTNSKISTTITTELNWLWVESPKQHLFIGGSLERAVPNWYGGIFRVSVYSALAGAAELAETMRGIQPESINDGATHLWKMDEGASATSTHDSITGTAVVLRSGVTWAAMDTCGDSILEGWEQCDTAVGLNCTQSCSCSSGTFPTSPPSVDCSAMRAPSSTSLPVAAAPSLEEESKQLTWKVLLAVWAIALGGAGAYFIASKFWRRYLPPKVPTAVIVRVGTENDLRLLERGERMDDKRAEELLKTDLQTTRELYSDIDEEELAKKAKPPAGTLAKTWSAQGDHNDSRARNLELVSKTISLGGTPKTVRRRMEDLDEEGQGIPVEKFGRLSFDDGDDMVVSLDAIDSDGPQYIKSAPVSPRPRRDQSASLSDDPDDIM
eukprot:TRINITY_DN8027_c0_g1_i1.p1 TRINITY_DN8027_c0_g1~~TRINITY_DN8027_c0_g1_i1.p1  ORF type:complete len:526 (-),score=57.18 TRINITY_DN8027_c0_g1_i1:189-1766(-)